MNSIFLKLWFGTILSLLSSLLPTWTLQDRTMAYKPVVVVSAKASERISALKVSVPKVSSPAAQPNQQKGLRSFYFCSFTGKATYKGQPYENAKLLFWITTPNGQEFHELQTAQDGSYELKVPVSANINDPIDWEIKGETPDFKTIERAGRQIALQGQSMIAVQASLEFPVL